jgi:L-iditol 2-dehydrogenase
MVGLGKFEMTVPLTGALIREVNIRGVFRYNNE